MGSSHRLCVAPMLDWTDRHCRYFHRQLSPRARLYTEMITTGALLHGDVPRHLDFDPAEHPVALQLGGSEPHALAACARLGMRWGYDEINLNCGCPSERVQNGSFGACLMAEPDLVADGVKAMIDAVDLPVTVKHRIGLDRNEDYGFVRDFVGTVAAAGCATFIVHARNAWLKGLSPKENREVPPLRYDVVAALQHDFPQLAFVVNGGLTSCEAVDAAIMRFGGAMIGRAAYHDPWLLAMLDGGGDAGGEGEGESEGEDEGWSRGDGRGDGDADDGGPVGVGLADGGRGDMGSSLGPDEGTGPGNGGSARSGGRGGQGRGSRGSAAGVGGSHGRRGHEQAHGHDSRPDSGDERRDGQGGVVRAPRQRSTVVAAMARYAEREAAKGVSLRAIVRHMLGLYHGRPAARTWRRLLSDSTLLRDADVSLLWRAMEAVEQPVATVA